MADNTSIAFGLKIDGVEQSIKSVKDLKSAIKSLQDEAEGADIGSEQYKNAIENIEKLNEKLQEVTRTEKQAAKATEDLANAEQEAAKETGDLRKQFEKLEDELFMLAGQGKQNTKEFRDLSAEAANLNAKIDEVNQTLGSGSSGIDKLGASFGMLSEGLTSMNFDKIKTGFKGLGSAMNAVPLMLLVSGITMLMEKFDVFGKITEAITDVIYAFTDAIGLTNKADEKAAAEMIENSQKVQKAKEDQYDKEIKLAKAAGKDIKQLELEKLKSSEEATQQQINKLEDLQNKKGKLSDEEQKQYDELQQRLLQLSGDRIVKELEAEQAKQQQLTNLRNLEEKLRVAGLSDREKEIDAIKKQQEALMKELVDNHEVRLGIEKQDTMRYNEDVKKINELTQIEINKINSKYGKEAADKRNAQLQEQLKIYNEMADRENAMIDAQEAINKKIKDDRLALEKAAMLQDENMYLWVAQKNREAREKKEADDKAARDKELAELKALEDAKFDIIRGGLDNAQKVSDLFFEFKSKNLVKGSKEEEEVAKKQFQVNKAISLTLATNNGVEAVLNAFKSGQASPITPFFPAFPFVQASLAGVFAAANIAKIASSKFQPSGGGGGGGDVSAPMPSIPAPPTIATSSNNTNQSTTFDESGKNLEFKQPQINVTATVGVDEIAKKSNRVSVLENQSTF